MQDGPPRTDEPDSVEEEFGGEYSSETLDLLRSINKPEYLEESSSLDPVSDLSEYLDNSLAIPPATYDALQEIGKEKLRAMEELKDAEPDASVTDTVRYRQALAQGTRPEDMTWLKLRAYHRAMNELKAVDKEQGGADGVFGAEEPAEPTIEELSNRQRVAQMARTLLARRARQRQDAVQRILSQPDPSEESEWVAPQPAPLLSPAAAQGVIASLCEHQGSIRVLPAVPEQGPAAPVPEAETQPATEHAQIVRPAARTVYTQTYLDQQALRRKVQRQQRQRSAAFWLSLLTVSGETRAHSAYKPMTMKLLNLLCPLAGLHTQLACCAYPGRIRQVLCLWFAVLLCRHIRGTGNPSEPAQAKEAQRRQGQADATPAARI